MKKFLLFIKKRSLPLVAAVMCIALALSVSAFRTKTPEKKFSTFYFQYSGADNETDYETQGNWTALSSMPGSDPCPGANNIVCVLNTNDIATGTTAALVTYLQSLPSAASYCETAARITYKKP